MGISMLAWLALMMDVSYAQDEASSESATDSSVSQEASEPDEDTETGPDPQEVLAFKGTVNRFVDRMQEFNDEARNIIQGREKDERDALIDGYRGPLSDLRTEEVALRDTAIGRLEGFLVLS